MFRNIWRIMYKIIIEIFEINEIFDGEMYKIIIEIFENLRYSGHSSNLLN